MSPTRRLTRSSTSSPRCSRFSCTWLRSSSGVRACGHPPFSSRRAPTLVTMCSCVRVRRERLADDLVGDVRPVEVGGVDVGDAELDGLAKHGDCCVAILRRAEDSGAGELHRAVADAGEFEIGYRVGAARQCLHSHGFLPFRGGCHEQDQPCPLPAGAGSAPAILGVTGPGYAFPTRRHEEDIAVFSRSRILNTKPLPNIVCVLSIL